MKKPFARFSEALFDSAPCLGFCTAKGLEQFRKAKPFEPRLLYLPAQGPVGDQGSRLTTKLSILPTPSKPTKLGVIFSGKLPKSTPLTLALTSCPIGS